MIPTDPIERDLLAGEYVLGTLDADERAEVAAAIATDPALAEAVEGWERHLAPLAHLAPLVEPPAELWSRIAGNLGGPAPVSLADARLRQAATGRPASGIWQNVRLWRWSTGIAAAIAAMLALVVVSRPPPTPGASFVAVLQPPHLTEPAYVVEAADRGGVILTALRPSAVEPNRSLQLWSAKPGEAMPVSLGVIPSNGRFVIESGKVDLQEGLILMISREPAGGSPTGLPTGPVVYSGKLTQTR